MSFHYHCLQCGKPLHFQGICSNCQAVQKKQHTCALTQAQVKSKIQYLFEHISEISYPTKQAYKDFWNFISFRGICPPELQEAALANAIYILPELYFHASSDICESLILSLMQTEDIEMGEQILYCIAMIGDKKALEVFYKLEQKPLYWLEDILPSIYAQYGGWTFDNTGKKQELKYDTCYHIIENQKSENSIIGHVREDFCAYCGCQLVDILILDGRDKRLSFLNIAGIITAVCCPECVCCETMFCQYTLDGKSNVLFDETYCLDTIENTTDIDIINQLQCHNFILSQNSVPVFYGANGKNVNTIGGFANWGENWYYTTCPNCGKTMKYLAQIQWQIVISFFEGTLYIEICTDCQIISMHCQ